MLSETQNRSLTHQNHNNPNNKPLASHNHQPHHNPHSKSALQPHRLNTWLNRSLNTSTHSRLYNDAKFHNAKHLHLKRMSNEQEKSLYPFQPQLITDPRRTMQMCAQRTRSIEARNEVVNQSLQTLYPVVKYEPVCRRGFKYRGSDEQLRSKLVEYRNKHRQVNNCAELELEKQVKEERKARNLMLEQRDVHELDHSSQNESFSSQNITQEHKRSKTSQGVMRQIIAPKQPPPSLPKQNTSLVIPYKQKIKPEVEDDTVQLRIHYSKSKCATIKINANSDPEKVARSFCRMYGLRNNMLESLISIITQKKLEFFSPADDDRKVPDFQNGIIDHQSNTESSKRGNYNHEN